MLPRHTAAVPRLSRSSAMRVVRGSGASSPGGGGQTGLEGVPRSVRVGERGAGV